ncbi:MAG: hypothetical protein MJ085_01305 [Clostridia bacterium]|nr:hypothetical protein [Clostridia bacterium]
MKHNLRRWLAQWDAGELDFTAKTASPELPQPRAETEWSKEPVRRLERRQAAAFNRIYPVLAAILCTVMIGFLFFTVSELPAFGSSDSPAHNEVTKRYVEQGMAETGAVNTVSGVILDYRAFDTLGESHVLFTATTAVLILLLTAQEEAEPKQQREIMQRDPILRQTAKIVVPLAMLFGIYVIFNGHLGPGGGFAGGSVIGGALILYVVSFGFERLEKLLNLKTFRIIVLCALCFYSLSKCYSFFCGANGLETIFSAGTPGRIFSAGLILPLNIAVGIVVACTMYGFYSLFRRGRI